MGKMPFVGLIGACSLGMLLTGCNCCDKNKNKDQPSFAGGRMDSSMGFFSKSGKGPESKFISSDGVAGSPAIDSADAASGTAAGSYQSSGNGSGSYTTDTAPPIGSGRMSSMGANMTSGSSLANPPSDSSPAAMTMSGAGSSSGFSPIRTVSHRVDDLPAGNAATSRSMSDDTTPALPMRGPVVPPTPSTADSSFAPYPSSKSSSLPAMGTTSSSISMATPGSSAPLPPPTPPPSNSFGDASASMNAGSMSSQPNAGGAPAANSGSMSMPSYLSGK